MLVACRKDEKIEEIQQDPPDEPDVEVVYEPNLPEVPYDYESRIFPDYFLEDPLLNFIHTLDDGNPVTNEGATLGRVLFYDKNLSQNNTVSCASCHLPENGFSDPKQFSDGFDGGWSNRNSMAIINVNFQRRFFWDMRANSIEEQVLMPIEHPVEMGMDLDSLVLKMEQLHYYKSLFLDAFGDEVITVTRVSRALSQFLKSIRSYESKYDQGLANDFADFTELELMGKDLFFSGEHSCINCHTTPNFGGVSSHINGLDVILSDPGVGGVSGNAEDLGKFKSVTLRNIELTAPYMHNGRFETLEEVLDFYSTEIQPHPYLDDRLTTNFTIGGPPKVMDLTDEEKAAYIAFLKTLTDWNLINNPIYLDPFPE